MNVDFHLVASGHDRINISWTVSEPSPPPPPPPSSLSFYCGLFKFCIVIGTYLFLFFSQLSRPVKISKVAILWRTENSSIFYTNYESDPGSSCVLTGVEANTSYVIKVHVMSEGNSIPISDKMTVTTNAKRM